MLVVRARPRQPACSSTATGLAWRIRGDRGSADDSAQEAFVKAFAALGRFDETQPSRVAQEDRYQRRSGFPPVGVGGWRSSRKRQRFPHLGARRVCGGRSPPLGGSGRRSLADDSPPHRGKPPGADAVQRPPRGHPARLRPLKAESLRPAKVQPATGRSAAWLARPAGGREVVSSNLTAPTEFAG